MSNNAIVNLGQTTDNNDRPHTPSDIQADSLFTFTTKLEYLLTYIKETCLYPRYCDEDIRYLRIDDIEKICIPMKCFCDINLHRIKHHMDWYGSYGIAFSKQWGLDKGIQPIHYINAKSALCKDFSLAFNSAIKKDVGNKTSIDTILSNYLLHNLFYLKPYEGLLRNRKSEKLEVKCFTEESEWRFIPNLSGTNYPQVIYDEVIVNSSVMGKLSNSLMALPAARLNFDYSDIKYIIVQGESELSEIWSLLDTINLSKNEKYHLLSKIIVWETSKGDF